MHAYDFLNIICLETMFEISTASKEGPHACYDFLFSKRFSGCSEDRGRDNERKDSCGTCLAQ